jgi:multiple sugar transport system permease protein
VRLALTSQRRFDRLLAYGFVVPAIALLIALNIFPLVYTIVLSFTDATLTAPSSEWVGGQNYARVFSRGEYGAALRTTGLFVVAAVTVELVAGFALALALKADFRGKTVVMTVLLVPMMLSPAVMGLYWTTILDEQYGVLNQLLRVLGIGEPAWLTEWKLTSVLLVDIWMWTPFMMLIALAGLNSIPPYIYEAAEIDRASRWRVFTRITLPMCAPLLVLAVLLRTTDALKQFDLVMALTGPNDQATQTLSACLYKKMLREHELGLGCAYALVVLVMVIALATVFTRYIGWIQKRAGRAAA